MSRAILSSLAVAFTLALLATAVPAAAQGGGSVSNVAPTIQSFEARDAYPSHATLLEGVVADRNGEADLAELRLHRPSPPTWSNHTVAPADLQNASAPSNATAGWRIWDPAPGDGLLSWSYEWVPGSGGVHAWNLTAADEAASAWRVLNVSVRSPGGVGAGESPPVQEEPGPEPVDDPPASGGGNGGSPGSPGPSGPPAGMPRDLSERVVVTVEGGQVRLEWDEVPGALGYQVWRSSSPWTLRAELAGDEHGYGEPLPGKPAAYKVTFFTNRTAAGGWAADGEQAASIPGWDEGSAVALESDGSPADPEPAPPAARSWTWMAVALAATLLIAGAVLGALAWGRRRA